jgi:hypothetical protein
MYGAQNVPQATVTTCYPHFLKSSLPVLLWMTHFHFTVLQLQQHS